MVLFLIVLGFYMRENCTWFLFPRRLAFLCSVVALLCLYGAEPTAQLSQPCTLKTCAYLNRFLL